MSNSEDFLELSLASTESWVLALTSCLPCLSEWDIRRQDSTGLAWGLHGRGKDTVPWEPSQQAPLSWEAFETGWYPMCWQVHAVPKAGDTELCSDLRFNVPTRPHSHAIEVGTGNSTGLTVGVPQRRGQGSNHLILCIFSKRTMYKGGRHSLHYRHHGFGGRRGCTQPSSVAVKLGRLRFL